MLIVNADDWGYDEATTDAIAAVYAQGRICSASAMVHMRDARRAARIAGETGIPLGLHLNLMEPYDGEVDELERRRQASVVRRYRASRLSRWLPSPRLFALACRSVEAQLDAFAPLYGMAPTHVDGHQHGHLSTPALYALRRRRERAIRRSFTFRSSDKAALNRALRLVLNRYLSACFRSTDRFHSLRTLHPALGGQGLEEAVAAARERDVEIMVHPGLPDEYAVLTSEGWARLLDGVPLGSYRDLSVR